MSNKLKAWEGVDQYFDEMKAAWPQAFKGLSRMMFELPVGWRILFEELMGTYGKKIKLRQVKQKFGSLRIYADCDKQVSDFIGRLEKRSIALCEVCGRPGELRSRGGYVFTGCGYHKT